LPWGALLIIAPRHPERGESVTASLQMMNLATARRSTGEPLTADTQAYVADTLGEMGLLFALADVAVMGGSFAPGIGGHNPLEPARLGVPVVTGPHVFNFAEVYEAMVEADAAIVAPGFEELTTELETLVTDDARRHTMSLAAKSFAAQGDVALDAAWARLKPLLP
jgi:3-deoxy-D-manno-octulosonic-acid transferase